MRKRNQPENHYINKKRPCTTTLKKNLFSSLSLSCLVPPLLSSLLSLCPCLLPLSLSVSVSVSVPVFFLCLCLSVCLCLCLCLRVLLRVGVRGLCVCFVWCGVWRRLGTQKKTSVRRFKNVPVCTRHHAHMLKHICAWCRNTRGRFERTHGDVFHR